MRFTSKAGSHPVLARYRNSSLSVQENPELLKPIDYANIRQVTENMRRQIGQGTLDAPSWEILRSAKCAANIYAPLGTRMSLGDYVRLVKAYIDVFGVAHVPILQEEGEGKDGSGLREEDERIRRLCADLKVPWAQFPFPPNPLPFRHTKINWSTWV